MIERVMSPAEPTRDEDNVQQERASNSQETPQGYEAAAEPAASCPSCGARILHPIAYYCTTCGGLLEGAATADDDA